MFCHDAFGESKLVPPLDMSESFHDMFFNVHSAAALCPKRCSEETRIVQAGF